uniref:BACK domain-containing protein n=1 Tax=Steinernema glaseri TaxID=37863 RepID=A0A1I7ZRQ8_9BILA
MDRVPVEFMRDVINRCKSLNSFEDLSGYWPILASRTRKKQRDLLVFTRSRGSPDISFGFENEDVWHRLKTNRAVESAVSHIVFSAGGSSLVEQNERVDAESTPILQTYLARNDLAVSLAFYNADSSAFEDLKPVLLSIPRIEQLSSECVALRENADVSLSYELMKHAVQRGTLDYCVIAYRRSELVTIKDFLSSRRITNLCLQVERESDADIKELIRTIVEKWMDREDWDRFGMQVPSKYFSVVKKLLSRRKFKWKERNRGGGGKWIRFRNLLAPTRSLWVASKRIEIQTKEVPVLWDPKLEIRFSTNVRGLQIRR